jgi:hypothetical protein
MFRRTALSRILIIGTALAVALVAGIAWFRAPVSAEASSPRYLEVRLAQIEEVSPQLQGADPMGAVWAGHFRENLPAKTARACGAARFDVIDASDFHQAVQMPAPDATPALLHCMKARGGGYLRFATLDRQER